MTFSGMIVLALCLFCLQAKASTNLWSKQAASLDFTCGTKQEPILSPNKQWSVEVVCGGSEGLGGKEILKVRGKHGQEYEVRAEEHTSELLWAPDSHAFLLNGSKSGYWGFFTTVILLTSKGPVAETPTFLAQKDMAKLFPLCGSPGQVETDCHGLEKDPGYNMSGIAWGAASQSILVLSQVPCSSSYGSLMCHIAGYELAEKSGTILRRFDADQIRLRWKDLLSGNPESL